MCGRTFAFLFPQASQAGGCTQFEYLGVLLLADTQRRLETLRGVVGLGLLLAVLVSVARGLWRAAGPWDAIAAFAIFVSWIAGAMVQSQSTQGLAMLLLGLLLVRACVPTRPCLRR